MSTALVDKAAISLADGPAKGAQFIGHHFEPPYPERIRVVVDTAKMKTGSSIVEATDLLDLPEDTPTDTEVVLIYELARETLMHVCARGRGATPSGWWVSYRFIEREEPSE